MQTTLHTTSRLLANLVFPPHCAVCEAPTEHAPALCGSCFSKITFISDPYCVICGCPFDYDIGTTSICIPCQTNAPPYDRARAALRYDDASRKLITRLKFNDKMSLAPFAAQLMTAAATDILAKCEVIIPVPLHWRRLWTRQFNQSALIAHHIAKCTHLPFLPQALKRIRHTLPQMELSWEERQRNVKAAFTTNPRYLQHIKGKTVMLIDDVYTTGATIYACTQALKKSGVSRVYVLTLSRRLATDSS